MTKILISEKMDDIAKNIFLNAGFEVDVKTNLTPEDLMAIIGEYDGLVVRSSTKVTAEVLAGAKKLKVVGRAGAGVDTIDVPAATAAKVVVMNTPGQNANAVAELVFGLMLNLTRNIITGCVALKNGRWEKNSLAGTELFAKTIGAVGYGAIGRRVGAIAQGLGMKVLAYDPMLDDSQIKNAGAEPTTFESLLAQSNFITLHLPKTKETANMFNKDALALMKKGAVLINCARGGLIDETALYDALKSGHLAGAAMDVFEVEPPENSPLFSLNNFVCTPHLGASTAEAQVNVAAAVARQMAAYFKDGHLEGAVNV